MLDRCIDFLDRQGVRYSHMTHPGGLSAREVASAETMPAHSLVKTAIYCDAAGYGMAVIPDERTVSLAKVAAVLGRPDVRLATEDELAEIYPDSEAGALPPLGNLFGLPVLVDAEVASHPIVVFNAGTRHDVIRVTFADFRRLVNPMIASVAAVREPVAARTIRRMRSRGVGVRCRGPRESSK